MEDKSQAVFNKLKSILDSVAEAENIKTYISVPDVNQIKGEGFLSEFFTGKIINEENGENMQVAIKVVPVENAILDYTLFYNNEVHFYSKVFSELDKFQKENGVRYPFNNIPRYFAGNVQPKQQFVAMENLPSESYSMIDKRKYFSTEHHELIFKTYGKFHALSYVFKQYNPDKYRDLITPFGDSMGILVDSPFLHNQIKDDYLAALKTFDPVTEADSIAKLKKMDDIKKTIADSRNYTGSNRCITHGDCWSNNMLFKYKEGSVENVKLLDFQLMCESTPIHDLSYFFYSGASKVDMDKLDDYLKLYYNSFCNFAEELNGNLDDIFSLHEFKEEWKKYSHLGLLLGLHLWVGKLMNKDELLAVIDGSNLSKENQHKMRLEASQKVRESKAFKERGRNLFLHAVEYGIV